MILQYHSNFPVVMSFVLHVQKKLCVFVIKKCPKCRAQLPYFLAEWLNMLHIYPIQFTPDISLEKLQHVFPLICSVANLTIMTKCISLGIDVNTKGFNTFFPIHLASQKNVVKYLVEHGADVNPVTENGDTPLLVSSENGHLQVVEYLIENGEDVNRGNIDGATPLLTSSHEGHLPVVEYLIKHGADVNQMNIDGATPLWMSLQTGHLQVVEYLIKHGADVNLAKNNGTPLSVSSQNGHLSIVQYLIQSGADVNRGNKNGDTPLLAGSENGHLQVVEYLIKYGADVNVTRNDGTTPLFMSSQNGHLQVVQYLTDHGADVNQGTNDGITPLAVAIYQNQTEVAKFLLRKNANIKTAKLFFKKNELLELIDILDELYEEIKDSQNGHLSIVEYLLKNGAESKQATKTGETPLL